MLTEQQLAVANAQLEQAYRGGDLAGAAIAAWILSAHAPQMGAWKIYAKKILRETGADGVKPTAVLPAVDEAFNRRSHMEAFATLCLGLLANPESVNLLAKMIDLAKKVERDDLVEGALAALPTDLSDPNLLNIKAARAHEDGRYEESAAAFRALLAKRPDSVDLKLNLSAALTGLEQWEAAIELLESVLVETEEKKEVLFRLVPLYRKSGAPTAQSLSWLQDELLADVDNAAAANVKALVSSYLERFEDAIAHYQRALEWAEDAKTRFDLSLVQLKVGDYDAGFENYRQRFVCFPDSNWLDVNAKRYDGRVLGDESLLVWAEQGVGDEVFFGFALEALRDRVGRVTLAVDTRLVSFFVARFSDWRVIARDEASQRVAANPTEFDFEIPMGELMPLFLGPLQDLAPERLQPLFTPSAQRLEEVRTIIAAGQGEIRKPAVAISWRGGTDIDGKARSMTLPEIVSGIPAGLDVDIISLQYSGDVGQEIADLGDPRVRASGLHNRNDLEGVITLLTQVDAVISVDNAVVHFAAAVGTPVEVMIPRALSQFRFKNEAFRSTFFPGVHVHLQSLDGDWQAPVRDAWSAVLARFERSQ